MFSIRFWCLSLMIQVKQSEQSTLLLTPSSPTDVCENWFSADFWHQQNKIYAQKTGRASTWFFEHHGLKAVIRHYWRGGLVGKIVTDQYFNLGLKKSRVYQEFALLAHLSEQGFNVPKPIAAQFIPSGLIYRGDIITQAIEGAQSVLDILQRRSLTQIEIKQVAHGIAKFHNEGVFHADLNINNILFDHQGEVYLIDFDRGQLKTPAHDWQHANMARLQRSFNKQQAKHPVFYWQHNDWQTLHSHYLCAIKKA